MNLVVLILLAFFGLVILGELAREVVVGFWAWFSTQWDGLVYGYSGRVAGGYDPRAGRPLGPGEVLCILTPR